MLLDSRFADPKFRLTVVVRFLERRVNKSLRKIPGSLIERQFAVQKILIARRQGSDMAFLLALLEANEKTVMTSWLTINKGLEQYGSREWLDHCLEFNKYLRELRDLRRKFKQSSPEFAAVAKLDQDSPELDELKEKVEQSWQSEVERFNGGRVPFPNRNMILKKRKSYLKILLRRLDRVAREVTRA